MSGWMSYFTGRKDNRQSARDSIVSLRQQLLTLDKREEFLQKKIEEELKKAKANATSNKKRECPAWIRSDIVRPGIRGVALFSTGTYVLTFALIFSRYGSPTSETSVRGRIEQNSRDEAYVGGTGAFCVFFCLVTRQIRGCAARTLIVRRHR